MVMHLACISWIITSILLYQLHAAILVTSDSCQAHWFIKIKQRCNKTFEKTFLRINSPRYLEESQATSDSIDADSKVASMNKILNSCDEEIRFDENHKKCSKQAHQKGSNGTDVWICSLDNGDIHSLGIFLKIITSSYKQSESSPLLLNIDARIYPEKQQIWQLSKWGADTSSFKLQDGISILKNQGIGVLQKCGQSSSYSSFTTNKKPTTKGNSEGEEIDQSNGCSAFQLGYYEATYQFLAVLSETVSTVPSCYFGAHDKNGEIKTFSLIKSKAIKQEYVLSIEAPIDKNSVTFKTKYPIAVQDLPNQVGNWYDAAMVYRSWIFENMKMVHVDDRIDLPFWAKQASFWLNSHWQDDHPFDKKGGNPSTVLDKVNKAANKLNLPRGSVVFHWYEWDKLGYLDSGYHFCPFGFFHSCGFDTHYPQYLHPRYGMLNAVKKLRKIHGIEVIPYVNGRLFDVNTLDWVFSGGKDHAVKNEDGDILVDNYQSGTKLAVMCPSSSLWQDRMVTPFVRTLIRKWKIGGLYIDQIGKKRALQCYSDNHNHSPGSLEQWTKGYKNIVQNLIKGSGADRPLIITESNSEVFVGDVHGFLVLDSLESNNDFIPLNKYNTGSRTVPVFHAIYGGYMFLIGSLFRFENEDKDITTFIIGISRQFLLGYTGLGWIALTGQYSAENLLQKQLNERELTYFRVLVDARIQLKRWLVEGRSYYPPEFSIKGHNKENGFVECASFVDRAGSSNLVSCLVAPVSVLKQNQTLTIRSKPEYSVSVVSKPLKCKTIAKPIVKQEYPSTDKCLISSDIDDDGGISYVMNIGDVPVCSVSIECK